MPETPAMPPAAPPIVSPVAGSSGRGASPPLWTRPFVLLMASSVVYFLAFQLLLPTLPVFAVDLSGSEAAAGLIMSAFTIAAMLARPLTGWAADTYGRRALLIAGTALSAAAVLGYVWVAGVASLLVLRLIHGVGFGVATTASGTVAADLVPRRRLGEGMGFFALAMSLPLAVAPVVGLAMTAGGDYTTLFSVAAVLTAGSLVVMGFMRVPRPERSGLRPAGRRPLTLSGMYEAEALAPAVITVLLNVAYGPVLNFIGLYGEERGIAHVGVFFTAYALTLTVMRPAAGRLADRVGYERGVAVGAAVMVAALVVLAGAGSLQWIVLSALLYGVGFGAAQPSLQALAVYRVSSSRRGAATAMYYTAFDLGIAIGSLLGGLMADAWSLRVVYALSIIPMLAALALTVARMRRGRRLVPAKEV